MKNIILTIPLMLIMSICYGQKMLNEVKLRNSQIEEIDISSIADFETYRKEKFNNSVLLKQGGFSKLYKLKGSDDFLIVAPNTNKELIENWDKSVLAYFETLTSVSDKKDRYTENIIIGEAKAVIFFRKNYKIDNKSFILYQNPKDRITLIITYLSNLPDKDKLRI